MGLKVHNWSSGLIFLLILNQCFCEEGSLQGALNAINKRQQDMYGYPKYGKLYSESGVSRYNAPDNDLVFLGPTDPRPLSHKDRSALEYLEDMDLANRQHVSSPFRERTEENKLHEKQKLAEMILNNARNSEEYADLLKELHQRYEQYDPQDYYPEIYEKNEVRKRSRQYPNMGMNMVGMKKRSRNYSPPDESPEALYLLNVPSKNQIFPNTMSKRFPVTKRSSTYYPIPFTNEMPRQFKRSSPSLGKTDRMLQTDPKVAEDLSSIFNHNSKRKADIHNESDKTVTKPKRTEHPTETTSDANLKSVTSTTTTTKKPESKESITDLKSEKEKPIQLKKKSIDWSDYFGIDKRKKDDNLDNEWLMERYHKAIALNSKRNSDNDDRNKSKSYKESTSEEKINEMDTKLKNIEYAIVDDALKMSGNQRDDEMDTKEEQEMKDKIIAQLAAAYSLEKMRRALNEYRESIRKDKLTLVESENQKLEEKRLSVPRKSAVDTEMPTADNSIKCVSGDENCIEQNYKTPEDLLDNNNYGYCPKIQRACSEIASVVGQYEKMLETACTMHQMCLLCGDNTWYSPTRQCNVLFLNKADYLCNDDVECKEVARHSTRYLLELNRLLKSEPLDSCDLAC